MDAFVQGVSVWGPGLQGWATSQPVLAGLQDYVAGEASPPPSTLLSATERRRTGLAARLALIVAQQASDMAGIAPGAIPSVFATSNGDGAVVHTILEGLAADQPVSPTQFHNSVHNTAAGYWSIATGSQQATTCLACHDATAAAALLKAMAEVQTECRPLLLCVYDVPLPAPLDAKRQTCGSFGAAFVLAPGPVKARCPVWMCTMRGRRRPLAAKRRICRRCATSPAAIRPLACCDCWRPWRAAWPTNSRWPCWTVGWQSG